MFGLGDILQPEVRGVKSARVHVSAKSARVHVPAKSTRVDASPTALMITLMVASAGRVTDDPAALDRELAAWNWCCPKQPAVVTRSFQRLVNIITRTYSPTTYILNIPVL